jgi:hypothetical protein
MGQPLFGMLLMYGLRTDLLDSSTLTSRPSLAKRSTRWVVVGFRFADNPGVDRFDQRYRVFHAPCELGGAQSIRDNNQ